jgi:hypothetical protein
MKRLVLSMTAAAGLLVASSAFAALTWSSSTTLKVVTVDIEGDPTSNTAPATLWLKFSSAPMSVSCTNGGAGWWKVVGDPAALEAIRAVALSAKLADLPVKVLFQNSYSGTQSCDGGGTTGSPLVRGLQVI